MDSILPHLPTKKEKMAFYSDLLQNYGTTDSLKETRPEHFEHFKNLFKHHPNKNKTYNMVDLKIIKNPQYGRHMLIAVYNDKEDDTIAYRTPFLKVNKTYALNDVMRNAIEYQTIKFRRGKKQVCNNCGFIPTITRLCVDHYQYPFIQIRDEFLKIWVQHNELPKSFVKDLGCRLILDTSKEHHQNFYDQWVEYHESKARFRMLCRRCNSKCSAYGYKL